MTMFPLKDVQTIGCRGSVAPDVPFACCNLLGESTSGVTFELATFENGQVSGVEFSDTELRDAIRCGDATEFPVAYTTRESEAWLVASPALASYIIGRYIYYTAYYHVENSKGGKILILERRFASQLRKTLHTEALSEARSAFWQNDAARTLHLSDLAWLLATDFDTETSGTLVAALQRAGEAKRAEFYLRTFRFTWGNDAEERTKIEAEKLLNSR